MGCRALQSENNLEESSDYGRFSYYEQRIYYIDKYICPLFTFETTSPLIDFDLKWELRNFPKVKGEKEPKVNILAWREKELMILVLIPRSKHRPDCFYAEGDEQYLVSPGALDMAGILVTARPEDFERIDANQIKRIIQEVSLSFEDAEAIAAKYKQ